MAGQKSSREKELSNFPVKRVVDSKMLEGAFPSDRVSEQGNFLDEKEEI